MSLLHALVRRGRVAWVEQLALAAGLFCAVPLVDALSSEQSLRMLLAQGDWARLGFDLTCLGSGVFLAWAAWKMRRAAQLGGKAPARAVRAPSARSKVEVN
ncbi:hypothetical protein D3C81_2059210 [compost metagenome]